METNKKLGYYYAKYVCLNCKQSVNIKVAFGKSIPVLSNYEEMVTRGWAISAPECEYCGCSDWSRGMIE